MTKVKAFTPGYSLPYVLAEDGRHVAERVYNGFQHEIATAMNCHDTLVAACREAYEHCADHGHADMAAILREALKAVEEAKA